MNTLDVLRLIGEEHSDLEAFSFHTFPPQKLIQEQLPEWDCIEREHYERAMKVRDELKIPFWDAVMAATFDNPSYSVSILRAALRHNHVDSLIRIRKTELCNHPLLSGNDERMAVCSAVLMKDGQLRHLPMLDFHIPVSETNLGVVEQVCRILELGPGYILNSGESYHFISSVIVSWDDLYLLLAKALRFCPIIDRAWISHQLEEKSCSLRVDRKNSIETKVVKVIR